MLTSILTSTKNLDRRRVDKELNVVENEVNVTEK